MRGPFAATSVVLLALVTKPIALATWSAEHSSAHARGVTTSAVTVSLNAQPRNPHATAVAALPHLMVMDNAVPGTITAVPAPAPVALRMEAATRMAATVSPILVPATVSASAALIWVVLARWHAALAMAPATGMDVTASAVPPVTEHVLLGTTLVATAHRRVESRMDLAIEMDAWGSTTRKVGTGGAAMVIIGDVTATVYARVFPIHVRTVVVRVGTVFVPRGIIGGVNACSGHRIYMGVGRFA